MGAIDEERVTEILCAAMTAEDGETLVIALTDLTEKQRRAVLPRVQDAWFGPRTAAALEHQEMWRALASTYDLEEATRRFRAWTREHPVPAPETDLQSDLYLVVLLGLANPTQTMWYVRGGSDELLYRAAANRPRAWRQRFVERSDRDRLARPWWVVHRMVRSGLVDPPERDFWLTGALESPDIVLEDAEWLADELWRIFTVEAAGVWLSRRLPAGAGDGAADPTGWGERLAGLASAGVISRSRLIDESLAAQRRDFAPRATSWYRHLYALLDPSVDEEQARGEELTGLLHSPDSGALGFALGRLEPLSEAGLVPVDALLDGLALAAAHPAAVRARQALKLAAAVAATHPPAREAGVRVLLSALGDPRPPIQKLALARLKPYLAELTSDQRAEAASLADVVDPGLRPALLAALGVPASVPPGAGVSFPPLVLPPLRTPDRSAPRLGDLPELRRVRDVDELLERIDAALSDDDDVDEIEVLLDGVARFAGDAVPMDAVRRIVNRRRNGWIGAGVSPTMALHEVVAVRLGGRRWNRDPEGWHAPHVPFPRVSWPVEVLLLRLRELIADEPTSGGLFSTPTHAGGWIAPATAVSRLEAAAGRPSAVDLAQLVLRLAPDDREVAARRALRLGGEPAEIVAHALGADGIRARAAGPYRAAWAAAADVRDPASPPLGDVGAGGPRGEGWYRFDHPDSLIASPVRILERPDVWWRIGIWPDGLERWLTTVWPGNREACYRLVTKRLGVRGDDGRFLNDVLEHLIAAVEPMGPRAVEAIAMSLGAADVGLRAVAAEVLVAGFTDRRLDGATLGDALAAVLTRQRDAGPQSRLQPAVPSRWVASLDQVVRTGPLGAHEVQQTIEHALAGAAEHDGRRLGGVVDLLRRVALDADAAVTWPAARTWLAARGGHPAAVALLGITGDGGPRIRAALAQLQGTA